MTQLADRTSNIATTLIDSLIASNRGDRDAFSFNARRYSYQDVAALMNRTGNMMKRLGVARGAPVLLLLPPSPALVASVLGAIKAGAVPVVGAPRDDAAALEQCVGVVEPSAAVVHQNHLPVAGNALAAIPHGAVVVVGTDAGDYKSFVQEVREQSSWLVAEEVPVDAPALGIWTGAGVDTITHAALGKFIGGDLGGASAFPVSGEAAVAIEMLRAFSKGEEAKL
jgi:acyl-coenzyme A synthetase/AMP-(fatty) acid ligase